MDRAAQRESLTKNAGTVLAFCLFKIDWSAPRASCLILKLSELRDFAVNLGRLSVTKTPGQSPRFREPLRRKPRAIAIVPAPIQLFCPAGVADLLGRRLRVPFH